ncbi:hypothetical protein [Pararhizobium sp.]|uniref:hypothetical protein n=1 Tax=Pararhizobium sp. TaxID=1977563 RepID=UPI00271FE9CB|nr:hypothetical protein [Pararhizobium sp.]MDO9417973.1 hypothetical protein [Pararhizobium sp.]
MKTERMPIMVDSGFLRQIDDYSFAHRIRTRAETVRILILRGMENDEKKKADVQA